MVDQILAQTNTTRLRPLDSPAQPFVTVDRLFMICAAAVAILAGGAMLFLPDLIKIGMIGIPFAGILVFLILRNPYVGVYTFFLYGTLRPYDFLPALIPLRITLLIEVCTLAAWLISLAINKRSLRWTNFHTLFVIFVGVIGLTVITATNNFSALISFEVMIVPLIMFIIAADVVNTRERLNQLIWMMLIIHGYFAVRGIFKFATGGALPEYARTSGVVGSGFLADENEFAMSMNMMVPFCVFGLAVLKGKAKLICASLLVLFVMAVVASFSRGGLVGLILVLLFVILVSRRKILMLGVAACLALLMFVFAPQSYWDKASTTTKVNEGTANTRILYWKSGLRMFAAYPILGVGADNSKIVLPLFYQGPTDPNRQWGRQLHGTWPQVLAELGLMGAIPYFLMMILAFRYLIRIRRDCRGDTASNWYYLSSSLIGSLIAYIGCATFLSTTYFPQLWNTYTLIMILMMVYERDKDSAEPNPVVQESVAAVRIEGGVG